MDTDIRTYKKFNNEIDLWLKMVDSLAYVITASTGLIRSMHPDSEFPVSTLENQSGSTNSKNIHAYQEFFPCTQHPFDNISDKFKQFPQGKNSIDYLDQEYRKAKQAIFKRYGPSSKITTLYTRNEANVDFIDDQINEQLYKISEKSSDRKLEPFATEAQYGINRTNSECFETY